MPLNKHLALCLRFLSLQRRAGRNPSPATTRQSQRPPCASRPQHHPARGGAPARPGCKQRLRVTPGAAPTNTRPRRCVLNVGDRRQPPGCAWAYSAARGTSVRAVGGGRRPAPLWGKLALGALRGPGRAWPGRYEPHGGWGGCAAKAARGCHLLRGPLPPAVAWPCGSAAERALCRFCL